MRIINFFYGKGVPRSLSIQLLQACSDEDNIIAFIIHDFYILRSVQEEYRFRSYAYTVSQEERTKLREGVPSVKLYRYNPKHLYLKLNGYGDNGK